jgi:hypothetical protein
VKLGFEPKPRQTTADFLTSVTSAAECCVRKDFLGRVPVTADDFSSVWRKSHQRMNLLAEIEEFNTQYPIGGSSLQDFRNARRSLQAKSQYVYGMHCVLRC